MKNVMNIKLCQAMLICGVVFSGLIGALSSPAQAQSCVPAPSGLVSWWPGNGNAQDIQGSNDGTLQNGTTFATGRVGQAFSFDGVDDRLSIPDAAALKLTSSLTIEGWIFINALPSQAVFYQQILFRGDNRGGLDPYFLAVTANGKVLFHIASLKAVEEIEAPITKGRFLHVAATLNNATGVMNLYVDGVLSTTKTTAVRPFAELDPAFNPGVGIGNHPALPNTAHSQPFDGLIDEVSLYSRALSAGEVQGIYNAGSAGKCAPISGQPDLLIKQGGETNTAYALNNIYQAIPSGSQIERQSVSTGTAAVYQVKVQNDGSVSRAFRVRAGEGAGAGWTVVYKVAGTNINTAIRSAGGYSTGILAPGQSKIITVTMRPGSGAAAAKSTTLKVFLSTANTVTRDIVKAVTTVSVSTTSS